MGHIHDHAHTHAGGHTESTKNILTAFLLNLFFVIIEIIGGILTNSISVITDAIHDFGDCISIGLSYFLERLSSHRADRKYTYGYGRYSVLSALVNALVLIAGSCAAVTVSVRRIISPESINAKYMLILSVIGIIINGLAVIKTHHGSALNERVISLHMLEDLLGWIAVLAGSVFIMIFDIDIIDPILSLVIAVYIFIHACGHLSPVIAVLTERLPDGFDIDAYEEKLSAIGGVTGAHHIHVWTIDGDDMIATLHLGIPCSATVKECARIKSEAVAVSESFGICHVTVELCPACEHEAGDICADCCGDCRFGE